MAINSGLRRAVVGLSFRIAGRADKSEVEEIVQ